MGINQKTALNMCLQQKIQPSAYDTNLVNVELSTLLFLARGALTGCVTLFVVCCLTALSKVLRSSDKAAFFPLITSYILVYKPPKSHPINIDKQKNKSQHHNTMIILSSSRSVREFAMGEVRQRTNKVHD